MYRALRQGVGAWYFRKSSPEAIQTAIRWDPDNPEYLDALATLTHFYADNANPDDVIRLYENAVQLSPRNAGYWADLGAAYEWAGRKNEALKSFERGRELSPRSPEINWRLANFYIRAGRRQEALRALNMVLLSSSISPNQVFTLAANATSNRQEILDEMLPRRAPVFFDYLNYQIQMGRMDAAGEVWARLLEANVAFDLPQAFPYLDGLIQHRETDRLNDAWSALSARFPTEIHTDISRTNLITNGSFEFEPLNGGLDWRVAPVEGAIVSLDSLTTFDGVHSLRIEFDGTRNLEYGGVLQYVLVQPNAEYAFSAYMRVDGITTDTGLRMQIIDAYDIGKLSLSTENLVGSSEWLAEQLAFTTGADTHLLVVRVARPASHKLDNRLAGTVWIDNLSLIRVK
jgi:hypothetical protein